MHWVVVLAMLGLASCAARHFEATDEVGVVPKPSPGKAMVVFLRPSNVSFNADFRAYDGSTLLGVVGARTYLPYEADPGKHVFGAVSFSVNLIDDYYLLDAELAPDRTYYVLARPIYAWAHTLVVLEPLHPAHEHWPLLGEWMGQCRRSAMTNAAASWEQANAERIARKRDEATVEWRTKPDKYLMKASDGVR
jgi:hypothetical protein